MSLIFDKFYSSQLSFADLWEPYNGHRVPLQRLLSLGLGVLTRWHVGLEALIPNILNVAIFVMIVRELKSSLVHAGGAPPPAVLLFLSVICFSMNQYENWFNGWDIQVLLTELCSVWALLLLCREELALRDIAWATVLAIIASFSFGAGLATWPVGCIAILLNSTGRKVAALAIWLTFALITAILYTSGSTPETAHSITDLLQIPGYLASYLGSALFSINGENAVFLGPSLRHWLSLVAPIVGAFGVLAAALCCVNARRIGIAKRAINFPLMLCLFAVISGGLTAIARAPSGRTQAMSPHYITISRLLWVGVALLYCASKGTSLQGVRPRWIRITGGLVALMMLASYANGVKHLWEWHRTQLAVQAQLWTRYDDVTLRTLCPVLTFAQLHQGVEALKRNHLAHYAGVQINSEVGVYVPSSQTDSAGEQQNTLQK